MPLNAEIRDCYLHTGRKIDFRACGAELSPRVPSLRDAPVFGMRISWPKDLGFLTIRGRVITGADSQRGPAFIPGHPGLAAVAQQLGFDVPDGAEDVPILSAAVPKGARLILEFVVDTESPTFVAAPENPAYRAVPENPIYRALHDESASRGTKDDPAARMPVLYDPSTQAMVLLLPVDYYGEPIRSSLRIDRVRVRDFAENGWHPKVALWVIDQLAEGPGIGELIVGPKRLLAGRDWEAPRTLQVYNMIRDNPQAAVVPLRVPKRLPAELFICRVLEKFREASNREPMRLVITYPTTYTRRELSQLCQVVQRAWLRLRYQKQEDVGRVIKARMEAIDQERVNERDVGICLLLDEATAAAFYFLYRKIFDRPGGLPRFRYVYPHGLNMLLYDCGGGTTDIALVRAVVRPDSSQFLTIRVLDRTGLRDFGGDDITVAVFRVLKARLALEVAGRRGEYGTFSGDFPEATRPAALDDFLRENEDAFDRIVPTRFDRDHPDVDMLRNQVRTLILWRWAERLKAELSRREGEAAAASEAPMDLRQFVGELIDAPYTDESVAQFIEEVGKQVERWMVDALIRGAVERSVRKCNKLIAQPRRIDGEAPAPDAGGGATADAAPAEEEALDVHWVVTAGNASRYPLIQEVMREQLDIAFRKSRFEPLDHENLKHAVAKGAALAFKAINEAQNIRARFTDNLTNCLPYALGYKDLHWEQHSILFRENSVYAKMQPRRFEVVPKESGPTSAKQYPPFVSVDRRWPGDDDFDGHLQFERCPTSGSKTHSGNCGSGCSAPASRRYWSPRRRPLALHGWASWRGALMTSCARRCVTRNGSPAWPRPPRGWRRGWRTRPTSRAAPPGCCATPSRAGWWTGHPVAPGWRTSPRRRCASGSAPSSRPAWRRRRRPPPRRATGPRRRGRIGPGSRSWGPGIRRAPGPAWRGRHRLGRPSWPTSTPSTTPSSATVCCRNWQGNARRWSGRSPSGTEPPPRPRRRPRSGAATSSSSTAPRSSCTNSARG
jgi:hypothetical protein